MNKDVLNVFYKFNGIKNEFLKLQFIRLIRNKIIDPNTSHLLEHGFEFFDVESELNTRVPCGDCDFCEMMTFKEAINFNIVKYPFSIKLYHNYFLSITNKKMFFDIFKKMLNYRLDTVKRGWAIKYGVSYRDEDYQSLEDLSEKELISWKDPRKNIKFNLDMLTMDDFDRR